MTTRVLPSQVLVALGSFFIWGVNAAVDFQKCCTEVPVSDNLRPFQWDACHSEYNSSETDPRKKYAPAIETTYFWCRNHCEKSGIFQVSGTSQWLTPLAAWIIPASALLFLLPISEHLRSHKQTYTRTPRQKIISHYIYNWLHPMIEYVQILGDPASAFNGSLAQMIADWNVCTSLYEPDNGKRERELILTVILVQQADFACLPIRNALELMAGSARAREYSKTACKVIWSARKKFNTSVILPIALYIGVAAAVFYDAYQKLGDGGTSHSLAYGVWYNWILLLSVFSNCFASHSNIDAVRSGMEVIIRGVVENIGPQELEDLGWEKQAQGSLESYNRGAESLSTYPPPYPPMDPSPREMFSGSLECKGTPLHERYWNTWRWMRWLHQNGVKVSREKKGLWRYNIFWVDWEAGPGTGRWRGYLAGQVFSWLFVLYSCGCAATVSYTTPKVSLGCRSMNHILYAAIALLNALLRVLKDCPYKYDDTPGEVNLQSSVITLGLRQDSEKIGSQGPVNVTPEPQQKPKRKYYEIIVSVVYHFFVWLNALVILVGGSTLQITGVFNNCFCKAGIVDRGPDSYIPMSSNTFAHQYWARTVWLRVAYLAYGGSALICLVALYFRLYIAQAVRKATR